MQQVSEFWKTSTGKLTILGGGGLAALLFLCMVCVICGVLFRDTDTEPEIARIEPEPTETPLPTETPIPTETPAPTATPESTEIPVLADSPTPTQTPLEVGAATADFQSGGLGLSRSTWDQSHTPSDLDYTPIGTAYDGIYDVMFQGDNVWYIEQQWNTDNATTPDAVEAESHLLIPADSELIETYSPEGRPETTVNLYISTSLRDRFADDLWTGGEPGNFTVQYNTYEQGVTRLIITTGNNP